MQYSSEQEKREDKYLPHSDNSSEDDNNGNLQKNKQKKKGRKDKKVDGVITSINDTFDTEKSHCNGTLDDLPEHMVDNEFIKTGYRIGYKGYRNVCCTMFKCHNETFNVWSHFLGKLMFFSICILIGVHYPNMEMQGEAGLYEVNNKAIDAYIEEQVQFIEGNISFAKTEYLEHLQQDKKIYIPQERADNQSMIIRYMAEFMSKTEKISYLLLQNVVNLYSDTANLPLRSETDKEYSLIEKILASLEQIKEFMQDYREAIDDMSAFSQQYQRVNIIHRGITQFQKVYKDIQDKIGIWLQNDPTFQITNVVDVPLILTYVSRWPLVVHLLSACFCLGCSAIFHLFQIHSVTVNEILSRLDYGGISVLIMGSSYPPIFYGFACEEVYGTRTFFLVLITTTSTACFIMVMLPAMNTPKFRTFRAFTFIILGLSAGLPFVYLSFSGPETQQYVNKAMDGSMWLFGGLVYIGGALIYAFRFPERYFPKRFDLLGSSHQIFHVAVIAGCAIHFNESMELYLRRKETVCPIQIPKL